MLKKLQNLLRFNTNNQMSDRNDVVQLMSPSARLRRAREIFSQNKEHARNLNVGIGREEKIDDNISNMNENQDEKIINKIQYVDVLNVPINKFFFIAVNVNNNIVEVQLNNKINTITFLNGNVNISNEDIHIKYKPFFEGEIKNLHFIPEYASFDKLTNIYNQD